MRVSGDALASAAIRMLNAGCCRAFRMPFGVEERVPTPMVDALLWVARQLSQVSHDPETAPEFRSVATSFCTADGFGRRSSLVITSASESPTVLYCLALTHGRAGCSRRAAIVVNSKDFPKRLVLLLHRESVSDSSAIGELMAINRQHPAFVPLTAAWVLTNLTAADPATTLGLTRAAGGADGIALPLLQLLQAPEPELREQAGWAAANIAGLNALFDPFGGSLFLLLLLLFFWGGRGSHSDSGCALTNRLNVAAACAATRNALVSCGGAGQMMGHVLEHLLTLSPLDVPLVGAPTQACPPQPMPLR